MTVNRKKEKKKRDRIQHTGNDFKKVMYSNQIGPDDISDPGSKCSRDKLIKDIKRTCKKILVNCC